MQTLTKQTLNIFWRHAKKYPWHVFGIVFGVLAHIVLQNYVPLLYKRLIDALVGGNPNNLEPIIKIVKLILIVSAFRFTAARSFNYINNHFQPKVMADLNNTCFQYLHKHSYGFFSGNFVGSLVTKVKRFERSFEQISDQLVFEIGRTFLDAALILIVLLYQNLTIGFLALAWAAVYITFSYFFSLYKLPVDLKRAQIDSLVTAKLADSITNNFNIKTFSAYDSENKKFAEIANQQFLIRKKSWNLGTTSDLIQSTTMIALEVASMYIAVKMWGQGAISIGTIALINSYYYRLFDKFWNMGKNIRNAYEALADANEMTEILAEPHEVKDLSGASKLKVSSGQIEFRGVNFTYKQGSEVLNNFNLKIAPGRRVALIGPSGGGKTTIVKLLMRFYDIQSGQILIDGQDIAKVSQNSLRDALALVPQDPILFHRSLMENIRYGKPAASDEEVIKAAKLAHAHEFIAQAKDGYQTFVGERGIKLSGGERQRVAIARAVLKNAPILILDEATSSLDSESEMYIQDALKKLMENKTVIVIAHRLSTIMQMDRIIVLENGQIIEQGKHNELLKMREGTYQKLWQIQAGGFA